MAGEPVTVDAAEHRKLMDEWALAIGRFMVAFTACEYWTYLFVETFGSKHLRDATGDLMLGARAPLAESLVLDMGLVPEVHTKVEASFSKLKGLAKTRNLVAHNGPLLHAYRDQDGKVLLLIERKRSANPSFPLAMKLRTLRLGIRRWRRGEHGSTADRGVPGAGSGVSGLGSEGGRLGSGQWSIAA